MPYLVIIVDELADLMMLAGKEIERSITRLAQKSRGVASTSSWHPAAQCRRGDGLIKTNMPRASPSRWPARWTAARSSTRTAPRS